MENTSLTIGRKRRTGDEEVTWQPPEDGWCKMNVEAVCTNVSGTQLIRACGGLMRNPQGTFLQGFMMKTSEPVSDTPSTSNNNLSNAQLWGCMLGLKIAWDSGIRMLVIETTNSTVATAIQKRTGHLQAVAGDLRMENEIQQLLGREWEVRVLVVKCETNLAAYNLAQNALSCMPGFHMLHSLPQHVHELVLQEVPLPPENIKKLNKINGN